MNNILWKTGQCYKKQGNVMDNRDICAGIYFIDLACILLVWEWDGKVAAPAHPQRACSGAANRASSLRVLWPAQGAREWEPAERGAQVAVGNAGVDQGEDGTDGRVLRCQLL